MKALIWIVGIIFVALIVVGIVVGFGNRVAGTTDAMLIRYLEEIK